MLESDFWKTCKGPLEARRDSQGRRPQITRIENMVSSGMPDVQIEFGEDVRWVELKVIRTGNKPTLRPAQRGWLGRRALKGHTNIFVLARKEDDLLLWTAQEIPALIMPGKCPAPAFRTSPRWDWDTLAKIIFG